MDELHLGAFAKGKVENAFKFVYSDFLKGNTFHNLEDLNRKAEVWLRDVAWVRKHGTTQERPLDRMDEERPYLIALPARPFVAGCARQPAHLSQ